MTDTIRKTFKKFRVCLDTRCYSVVEVVCRDEDELWDIVRDSVSYSDYHDNMVGMSVSSERVGDLDYTPSIKVVQSYQYDDDINSFIEEEEDVEVEFDKDDYNSMYDDEDDEDY